MQSYRASIKQSPPATKPGYARLVVTAASARKATQGPAKTQPQLLARCVAHASTVAVALRSFRAGLLRVFSRLNVEELKLLSQLEKSGLLSTLEKQGLTLSGIEKAGLLSKAENLGLLSAASSPSTPTLLYILAFAAVAAGGAIVYVVPDTSAGEVAGQLVGAGILLGAGGAAFFGANLLASLQR